MTAAEHEGASDRDSLEAEIRDALADCYGEFPEILVRTLVLAAGGYAATQVEAACRPHPWPPPRRKRLDEARAQRQEARSA